MFIIYIIFGITIRLIRNTWEQAGLNNFMSTANGATFIDDFYVHIYYHSESGYLGFSHLTCTLNPSLLNSDCMENILFAGLLSLHAAQMTIISEYTYIHICVNV